MTDQSDPKGSASNPAESASSDRRSNLVLRALIDEMLERVRELNRNSTQWNPEDRAHAEADLDAIMARVRRVAAKKPTE